MKVITIFTGLVKINKNIVGTAVIYERLAVFSSRAGFAVNIVVPEKSDLQIKNIKFYVYNQKNNEQLIRASDIIIFGAYPPLDPLNYARKKKKKIITYMWSLSPLGSLEFQDFKSQIKQADLHKFITHSYNQSLLLSDKIFCRSAAACDIILGSLISLGRANLRNYLPHRNFQNLIEVAPFGISAKQPKHTKDVYRHILPGIKSSDKLLIWNGGVWNWNDGVLLIKAMKEIYLKSKNIKLIFQGFHNPDKIYSREAQATKKLSDQLKLTNKNIFFPENWIPFAERGNYLTECDVGIVTSPDIPESNYFIKTRFYDYLWAELPIILQAHEAFAPEVKKYNLGLILNTSKPQESATEVIKFLGDKKLQNEIRKNIRNYKKDKTWGKTLKPVIDYCKNI